MDFDTWRNQATEQCNEATVQFVEDNGLSEIFPTIRRGFLGSLIIYPGCLTLVQEYGRYRLQLGDQESISTDLNSLERSLFRWGWEEGRLS